MNSDIVLWLPVHFQNALRRHQEKLGNSIEIQDNVLTILADSIYRIVRSMIQIQLQLQDRQLLVVRVSQMDTIIVVQIWLATIGSTAMLENFGITDPVLAVKNLMPLILRVNYPQHQ